MLDLDKSLDSEITFLALLAQNFKKKSVIAVIVLGKASCLNLFKNINIQDIEIFMSDKFDPVQLASKVKSFLIMPEHTATRWTYGGFKADRFFYLINI